ncbi:MAG: polysaccharide deacetylase family protein [Candidatus Hermodarchaeota archaeon]
MKGTLIELAFKLYRLSGGSFLHFMYKNMKRNSKFGILLYHEISGKTFIKHISFLKRRYKIVSLNDLYEIFTNNDFPKNPSLVITFDDGEKSFYHETFPVIQKMEIPVIIYVITGGIENNGFFEFWWKKTLRLKKLGAKINKEYLKKVPETEKEAYLNKLANIYAYKENISDIMTNEQIKEISESDYVTIGSHSVTHPCLSQTSLERSEFEIFNSKKQLQKLLGQDIEHFAYPDGDYNKDLENIVIKSGYKTAALVENQWINPPENIGLFRLPRVSSGPRDCSVNWLRYRLNKGN